MMIKENHNTKKIVTVCVVTYNQEDSVRDTLDGILLQEGIDFKIIIAEDCSKDRTLDVCKEYADRYPELISIIAQSQNKGIILNTKDCFLAADTPFIALCEGDDYWTDPYKLRDQVEILKRNEDVSVVHSRWINWSVDSDVRTESFNTGLEHNLDADDYSQNTLALIEQRNIGIRFSTVCFRKRDLDRIIIEEKHEMFNPNFSMVDVPFFIEFSRKGKFYLLDRATTVYRIHLGSVSITGDEKKQSMFTLGVLRIMDYYFNLFDIPISIRHIQLRRLLSHLYPFALTENNKEIGEELIQIAKRNEYPLQLSAKICKFGLKYGWLYKPCRRIIEYGIRRNRK